MKVIAIVQARMGSTRLPGKVLRVLAGEPMLARVLERVQRTRHLSEVMVATSTLAADDLIADFCRQRGWSCFRGSENDVLERYVGAAQISEAEAVVRITADCPLIDPGLIDELIEAFLARQPELDYACNFHPMRTYPRGLDAEILRRDTLERCSREASDVSSREHVTAFIYRNPRLFRLHGLHGEVDYSAHRWTVDTPEDFALVETIYRHFGKTFFTWRETLAACEEHPQWSELNWHIAQKTH